MYILNISDRYIIRLFTSESELGIYIPNYGIASAAFTMLTYGLSKGFYPNLLEVWRTERDNLPKVSAMLSAGIKNYVFLALPAALGMILLSQEINSHLIAKSYASGYSVIGIVALGMFFLGLAEYSNKEWELLKDTKPIFWNSLIVALLNLILNFIFIPKYGFVGAAYTTAFSFLFIFSSVLGGEKIC